MNGSKPQSDAQASPPEWREQIAELIRENPFLAVLGAVALGFLVARLAGKRKTIYVEKSEP